MKIKLFENFTHLIRPRLKSQVKMNISGPPNYLFLFLAFIFNKIRDLTLQTNGLSEHIK